MVIEYIRYQIATERADAFKQAYTEAANVLKSSPYCKGYELSQGVEEPENWILRISWTSVSDHEQKFRSSPEFSTFLAAVRPYFQDIREMKHYNVALESAEA